ncbi:MAG: hydroxyacid dehydrogenase [Rhodovibrionaceae bacterium]
MKTDNNTAPAVPQAAGTVVIADPMHEAGIEKLRQEHPVTCLFELSEERKAAAIAEASVLVVRTFPTDNALFEAAPGLRAVVKHGSGVDNIDVEEATRRGIQVANTPGGANASSVAEGAVALMLAALRQIRRMDLEVRAGNFDCRWTTVLDDLSGGTLGIVGLGQIGRNVARICRQGFDMRTVGFDPALDAQTMAALGLEKMDTLEELAAEADVISVHVPLSEATRNLVDAAVLRVMKPSAFLVNTARGGVVDETALIAALKEGRIRGAGLDVFEQEPPQADNPLLSMDSVVLSPHVAGVTQASMRGMSMSVADTVAAILGGETPKTLLNPKVLEVVTE